MPTPGTVTITYKSMTPAEKAKMQAQVKQAMTQMNYSLNQHVNSPNQGPGGGHVGIGYGHAAAQTPTQQERKQPQDGVIRMVGSKQLNNTCIAGVFTYMVLMGFAGVVAGHYITTSGWELGTLFFIPMLVPLIAGPWILNKNYKEATAKADLLDWPKE